MYEGDWTDGNKCG
jgi:hypothetical protein